MTSLQPNELPSLRSSAVALYWLGTGLFIANDFLWAAINSGLWLFVADFIFRVLIVLMVFGSLRFVSLSDDAVFKFLFVGRRNTDQSTRKLRPLIWWAITATVGGVVIDQTVWPFLMYRLPATSLFNFASLNGPMRFVDVTLGVALVAVSEEIVFRSLAFWAILAMVPSIRNGRSDASNDSWSVFEIGQKGIVIVVVASSLVFGIIHWGNGVHAIVSASIWGILPMVALIRTGSIWPAVIAHYATDLVAFSGIVPPSYYQLFVPQ
jgi:hypothetical protein